MQLRVNTIRTCDAISSRKQVDRQLESSCNVTCSVITRSLHVHGPRAQKSERSERRSKRSERNVNGTFDATLVCIIQYVCLASSRRMGRGQVGHAAGTGTNLGS
jgi:hypothetical protein